MVLARNYKVSTERIDAARNCWGLPFYFMVKIRKQQLERPRSRKKRQELLSELAILKAGEDVDVLLLMEWAISASFFSNDDLQIIEDNRPDCSEFTARDLAIQQGMKTEEEIVARINLIYRWWKQSRETGSELPKDYLRTKLPEPAPKKKGEEDVSPQKKLEDMYRAGAPIGDIAREYGVLNKTITDYIDRLRAKSRTYIKKARNKALEIPRT